MKTFSYCYCYFIDIIIIINIININNIIIWLQKMYFHVI